MASQRPLDIDRLRKQRQLNVQEQNALTLDGLYRAAHWFRTHHQSEVPLPIQHFLQARGIDLSTAVDVDYEDMSGLGLTNFHRGLIVTPDATFWRWQVELDESGLSIANIEEWSDATAQYPVSAHLPGTGKSYGCMCIEVLRRLNAAQG